MGRKCHSGRHVFRYHNMNSIALNTGLAIFNVGFQCGHNCTGKIFPSILKFTHHSNITKAEIIFFFLNFFYY